MIGAWRNAAGASGLWRFVAVGAGDAVRQLARLTAAASPDETGVASLVESSAAIGAVDRVLGLVVASARTSVIAGAAAMRWAAWRGQHPVDRTRNTGIALLAAAGVHMALSFWQRPVAGWLWLVAPALAAAFGALMVCAPSRGLSPEDRS